MSTEITCWQNFLNCFCFGLCCYTEPDDLVATSPLIQGSSKEPHQVPKDCEANDGFDINIPISEPKKDVSFLAPQPIPHTSPPLHHLKMQVREEESTRQKEPLKSRRSLFTNISECNEHQESPPLSSDLQEPRYMEPEFCNDEKNNKESPSVQSEVVYIKTTPPSSPISSNPTTPKSRHSSGYATPIDSPGGTTSFSSSNTDWQSDLKTHTSPLKLPNKDTINNENTD